MAPDRTSQITTQSAPPSGALLCAHDVAIPLNTPCVMAILNVTPDSFSDGGLLLDLDDSLCAATTAVEHGADILDIGGESTRPGAQRVSADEQLRRVLPVVRAIRNAGITSPISIDTTRASVARACIDEGANIINDVSGAIEDESMLALASETGAAIILMHRHTTPDRDKYSTQYASDAPDYSAQGGVVNAVRSFLEARARAARAAGVPSHSIVLDPGLGFGKSVDDNLTLIEGTSRLTELGHPILSALSRKSFLGALSGIEEPAGRDGVTLDMSLRHRQRGASMFRVHDVESHARALR
ncbi:MAG: dihydropteroate synthase [Phycisphaerales bacterium JB043]